MKLKRPNNVKSLVLNVAAAVLALALIGTVIWGCTRNKTTVSTKGNDGIEQIDLNTLELKSSGVEVNFSDVILSNYAETRKLIVYTRNGTITYTLTDHLIKKLDFDFLKKTQIVSYEATAHFVVDLTELRSNDIIQDKKNKTVTIRIDYPDLEAIVIDPNKINIDAVNEGLLARGDIKLTVRDYIEIEKELLLRFDEKFHISSNIQLANSAALRMVKEVYEPIIKAIDSNYSVKVEFK